MNRYDRLFELIRKEEVVLFVGAGFSINAGYPSTKELSQIIYNNLTNSEKESISQNLPLIDLTDEFIQLRGNSRNSLISILKSTYGKSPVDLTDHAKIKSIPHLKNVITTNYDSAFENVYSDSHNLIFKDSDCSYIDKLRTSIFKIHGDLSVPDSIVITKSDYRHYFDKMNNVIFWTKVKDLLASYSVLFIGYSLEDDNIISIIESINNALGANRKEMYLIAPDWKEHKKQKLSSFGVKYFNDAANNFLNLLIENIKSHIKDDFDNKRITSETFTQFCEDYTLLPIVNIKRTKNEVVDVRSINNQPIEALLTLTVNDRVAKKINSDIFSENPPPIKIKGVDISSYQAITIPKEEISQFEYKLNGITFSDKSQIEMLHLIRMPNMKGSLVVKDSFNKVYTDIKYELYINKKRGGKLIAKTGLYTLTITFYKKGNSDVVKINWETEFHNTYSNNVTAKHWTELLIMLYEGGAFSFFLDEFELNYTIPDIKTKTSLIGNLKNHITYYENIAEIEKLQNVRFRKYNKFTEENFEKSNIILKFLRKEFELVPAKGHKTSFEFLNEEPLRDFSKEKSENRFILFQTNKLKEPMLLNGVSFNVNYKNIIFNDCKVLNMSIKDVGRCKVEFENISDYIQISYTEKEIKQEGLHIKLFD